MFYRKVLGHKCENNFNKSFKLCTIFHAKLYITQVIRESQYKLFLCLIVRETALLNEMRGKLPNLLRTVGVFFESFSSSS